MKSLQNPNLINIIDYDFSEELGNLELEMNFFQKFLEIPFYKKI